MVDVVFSAGRLLLAFVLVFLNGFFVASEFAYVRVRATAVETLVQEGRAGATALQDAMQNLDDYLAVTQLGITISSLGLGWIGEPAVAALIEPILAPFLPAGTIHVVAFAIGFGFITFLHVVFGELAPKTIAIAKAERVALFVAPFMKAFYYVFIPGIIVFNGTANFFTQLIGIPPASESDETLTQEEILTVLSRSGQEGHIDMEEVEMIQRVFDLDTISVREVMVPRPDVVIVPPELSLSDLRSLIIAAGHTRYPVVQANETERIEGYVDVKDVLRASEMTDGEAETVTAGDLVRDMPVVPETGQITDLLSHFQTEQRQMAAIIDEWGVFEGIATVEDIVEVIVGDIRDEFDVDEREPSITRRGAGEYIIDGGVNISTVNESLGTEFETGEFGTIGGFVLDRLGRAPEVGDQIRTTNYLVEVEEVDGARIARVLIREHSTTDTE